MKIQSIFRTQLMVIGFGAALMLASSAPAQEIDNTVWSDSNTTVMPAEQPAARPAATEAAANDLSATPDSGAINLAAMNTTAIAERESVASRWKPTQDWLLSAMVVCIMLAGVYAYVTTRRASARSEHENHRTALS